MSQPSSPNDLLDVEHLKTDLKDRSIRSGAVTIFAQGARFVIHTGSTIVLARLLTPADYGLIAMVTAVTNFVARFRDMGLSMATIQRAEVNHAQISTLFWINVAISVVLAAIVAVLSLAIAWFYGEPRLISVTLVLALVFIFGGLSIQHQALLRRQMRFGELAAVEVTSMVVGVSTAIVAGCLGAGYWSLVLMHVALSLTMSVGVWVTSGWLPGRASWHSGIRGMLNFGRNVVASRFVNYFARNLDNILLGRYHGSTVLGLYVKAYSLLMLPISEIRAPLTAVAMPALSRVQDDPRKFTSYYTKLVLLLSFISMPLVVFLAVCSKSVISLVLGDQWAGASPIFQILAVTAFIQPISTTTGIVLLSMGQSGRLLKFGIVNSSLIVLSFAVGVRWGAIGVAIAYGVANYLVLFPGLWFCLQKTPVSVVAFMRAIARPLISSVVTGLALILIHGYLVGLADIAIVGICFVVALCTYLAVWAAMPGGMQVLKDFVGYVALIRPKEASGS